MKRFSMALCVMLLGAGSGGAFASGGLSCEADDKNVALSIESGVTRGMGSPVFNFRAEAGLKLAKTPADMKTTAFEQANLAQYWLDGEDLRLVLYREREGDKPHGYVEITVLTKAKGEQEEGTYEGNYELTVFDGTGDGDPLQLEAKGTVSCFSE